MKLSNSEEITRRDDNILENMYLVNKNKSKLIKMGNELIPNIIHYCISGNTYLKSPKDENTKEFVIVSHQTVDPFSRGVGFIKVNTNEARISFIALNGRYDELLLDAVFDSNTRSWDVRNHINVKNKPSNIYDTLDEVENNLILGEDGIIYSELFRNMIDDINNIYRKEPKANSKG